MDQLHRIALGEASPTPKIRTVRAGARPVIASMSRPDFLRSARTGQEDDATPSIAAATHQLTVEDVRTLLATVLGAPAAESTVTALLLATEGNPAAVVGLIYLALCDADPPLVALTALLENGDASLPTEGNRIGRCGEYWTVAYGGTVLRVRHRKGLGYLAQLLWHPGILHPASRLADERRLVAVGTAKADRRARVPVTKAIRAAIDCLARLDPKLGQHLRIRIRTGYACHYDGAERAWADMGVT